MVELLAGALTGGAMEAKGPARNWGSLVICIDPVVFGTLEEFQASANIMCARVKNAKILPDHSEGSSIWLPGMKSMKHWSYTNENKCISAVNTQQ